MVTIEVEVEKDFVTKAAIIIGIVLGEYLLIRRISRLE